MLEAAEILLATGNYVLAERYAVAAERGCDLIVMATHGRSGFGELLWGSHTKNLVSRAKVPLLVLH